MKEILRKEKKINFLFQFLLLCYYPALLVRFARELWWTSQEFPPSMSFYHGFPWSYVTWGMNNRPVSGRSSET
jgi:apolipoprotein N-acyltransferase